MQMIRMPPVARISEVVRSELAEARKAVYVQLLEVKVKAREFIGSVASELPYIAYLLDTPLVRESILAVLAHPPDLTWLNVINPTSWITVSFFPIVFRSGKLHKPLIAKFFYTLNYTLIHFKPDSLALCGTSKTLCRFYKEKLEEEMRKPNVKNRVHAKKRVCRDIIRVYLGNAWLIATIDALEKGAIKPENVELPYIAKANKPINPSEASKTPSRWRHYTWEKLIKMLEGAR